MIRAPFLLVEKLMKSKLKAVHGTENLPQTPPVVVAANHVGFLDGPALGAALYQQYQQPPQFLTFDLMWRVWGGPLATKYLGMIRLNPRDRKGSLDTMISKLGEKKVTGIFPEGSRNDKSDLLPGKTGAVRMALASGAPLIPAGIVNSTGFTFAQAFASLFKPQQSITVRFGPPVDLSEFKDIPIDKPLLHAATNKLMLAISEVSGKRYPY